MKAALIALLVLLSPVIAFAALYIYLAIAWLVTYLKTGRRPHPSWTHQDS